MSTETEPKTSTEAVRSFKRVLSLWDLVLFGLAFVGPTAPYSMFGLGTVKSLGHLPLVYAVAMLAMSLTAVSYGRMAAAFPDAGSTYAYASRALHPHAGYFAGWGMILDYILIPLLSVIFVGLTANKLVPQVPYAVWVILAGAAITAINLRGIKVTARANTLLNAIMIGSLVWFVIMAVRALLSGVGEGALLSSRPFYNPTEFSSNAIMGATALAALSFLGFDGISTLAEDARNPRRDIWRATLLVCLAAGVLFILQSYLAQMVWPDFRTFSPVETAFMDVGKRIGGELLFYSISFVLLVGGIASAIAGQASASRLLYGMGRDRLLPHRIFGYVHPRLGTPVYSVMLMGAIHVLGAVVLRYSEAAELVNFGALLGFMAVDLSVWRLYFCRLGQRQMKRLAANLVLPFLAFAVCLVIWINLSRFALLLGAVWMGIGLVYLAFLTRGFRRNLADLRL
ncbi:MAG: APC family permease [Acidobacteria bacterium]|nr:MAG: APC family permease [Acidobacteriota bacterium]